VPVVTGTAGPSELPRYPPAAGLGPGPPAGLRRRTGPARSPRSPRPV